MRLKIAQILKRIKNGNEQTLALLHSSNTFFNVS